ncbi:hypothetical protein E2C01_032081 [Portunus trituberculatus]|uniref:Uncharacterized protein n=1 Tax=Portunus trituberculatus TaxID=210409 RepID=A0A5B7EUF7_PORTR|nr:hypothetical protein [Portunus trituberculatus]
MLGAPPEAEQGLLPRLALAAVIRGSAGGCDAAGVMGAMSARVRNFFPRKQIAGRRGGGTVPRAVPGDGRLCREIRLVWLPHSRYLLATFPSTKVYYIKLQRRPGAARRFKGGGSTWGPAPVGDVRNSIFTSLTDRPVTLTTHHSPLSQHSLTPLFPRHAILETYE